MSQNKGTPLSPIYSLLLVLAVVLNVFAAAVQSQSPPDTPEIVAVNPFERIGILSSKKISESSGLACSHFLDDAWWTMNDSGHSSQIYLFGNRGQTLAICELLNAVNRDWEAMSSFQRDGRKFLMVADVGDNLSQRSECQLYVLEEPKFESRPGKIFTGKFRARKFTFKYQDGPRNCEAVACQPDGSAVYLIEKIVIGRSFRHRPGVYRLELPWGRPDRRPLPKNAGGHGNLPADRHPPHEQETQHGERQIGEGQHGEVENINGNKNGDTQGSSPGVLVAQRVADFPYWGVTGMSISGDRKQMVVRNYLNAHLFFWTAGDGKEITWETAIKNAKPVTVGLPLQVQAEAICFTADGKHLIVTSETARQSVWKVRVDAVPRHAVVDDAKK